jgi:uncharacterized protein (DUF58 family)
MNRKVTIGRTSIRPTAYGWMLLFLLVWIPLAGIATANNFLLLIFFLMVGLTVLSHWLALRNIGSVTLSRSYPEDLYAGTPFSVKYVFNSDAEPWGATTLEFEENAALARANGEIRCARVAANGSTGVTGYFSVSRRGDVIVGPGTLRSAFPFGLAEYSRKKGPSDPLLVFPRIQPVDEEMPIRSGSFGKGMERTDPFGTIPFQFREYVPGDPYKYIEWKKSASTGTLITKVMSDESAKEITIRLPEDASEAAISKAASLVVHFGRKRTPICLEGPGVRVGPGHGGEFVRHLLTMLARWEKVFIDATLRNRPRGIVVDVEQSGNLSWKGTGGSHE